MYKTILHDYFYHFKTGLKNVTNEANWFSYFYVLVMLPMMNEETMQEVQYFFAALPMTLSLLLSRMYGGRMSKTFFLCPLSKEQRAQYIKEGICLRIGLSTALFLILNLTLIALQQLSWYKFGLELYVMLLFAISVNIYCQPISTHKKTNQKWYPLLGNYDLWNTLVQCSGIINLLLLSTYEGNEETWEYVLVGILFILQLIFCIVIVKKFYHQIIRQVTFYEMTEITDNDNFKRRDFNETM